MQATTAMRLGLKVVGALPKTKYVDAETFIPGKEEFKPSTFLVSPDPTLPLTPEGTCDLSPGDGLHQLVVDLDRVGLAGVDLREAAEHAEDPSRVLRHAGGGLQDLPVVVHPGHVGSGEPPVCLRTHGAVGPGEGGSRVGWKSIQNHQR